VTWDGLERALGEESAKSRRRGEGWVRAGCWGRAMGRQGLGDKQGVWAVQLGWRMEDHESQPREFPAAECLDGQVLRPQITCSNPG